MTGHQSFRTTALILTTVMVLVATGGSNATAHSLTPRLTVPQKNAINAAEDYLNESPFSKQGLIQQLSSSAGSGFPRAVAIFAVNHVHVNWDTEAVEAAKNYLKESPFSKQALIQQLSSSAGSGFTEAQAVYALGHVHVNWDTEAVKAAKNYLKQSPFSCQALIQQLSSPDGSQFTEAQAQYAAKKVGIC
jgi:hypothetical protein